MNNSDADTSFIAEALPAFISEAHEQIEMLEQLLLQLEDSPDDRDLLDALFRCAHTVKGSAGIFGLDRVVAFTHHVETLLDQLREGTLSLTPSLSTLLLQCNDQIRGLVDAAQATGDESDATVDRRAALVEQLKLACARTAPTAVAAPVATASKAPGAAGVEVAPAWRVAVRFGLDTYRNGMDPLAILHYVRSLGAVPRIDCELAAVPALDAVDPESCHLTVAFTLETGAAREAIEAAFSFVREDCTLELTELTAAPAADAARVADGQAPPAPAPATDSAGTLPAITAKPAKAREAAAATSGDDHRFIRVQADRLDMVINLLGELVIASAGASLLARQTRQGTLIEANQQITALVEEIRNGTLQLRMVPIGETFSRFRRVVRDTAAELGKDVAFEVLGGDTELDKSVVERIADPLMHLVRNALDHGLETPAERAATGKTAPATLTLAACHEAGSILIRIIDNGRGIQRERVLQRAWERGLVEQGVVPPDADILKLIFEAGFSTAEKVTNLSGRGVGMDVVRRNIEALRGSVNLSSEAGQGSRIEIRLPLTLAIIDGFLVAVGRSKFIFPLDAVVEVIEDRLNFGTPDARGRSLVELRGQMLPVVSLRTLYALEAPPTERCSVVVLQAGTRRYGVVVDQLLGQHQTVIKPLARLFRSLRGMSGSSILGNGEVALIFDVHALAQLAEQSAPAAAAGASSTTSRSGEVRAAAPLTSEGHTS